MRKTLGKQNPEARECPSKLLVDLIFSVTGPVIIQLFVAMANTVESLIKNHCITMTVLVLSGRLFLF